MNRLLELALLYGSRMTGVVVSLAFVPLYARTLGAEVFGIVALILSAQALMLMLDLGMASLATRELAAEPLPAQARARWRQAEAVLTRYFALLMPIGLVLAWVVGWPLGLSFGVVLMLWALTLQNLAQAAMVARGDVARAALLQGGGVLARGLLCVAALLWVEASLRSFVTSQLIGALAHMAVNRYVGQRALGPESSTLGGGLRDLCLRGLPLFWVGLAGAAVLQVDKLLVGALINPAAVTPYFLATTFCMTPIALLAAPVAQYFQPQIIRASTGSTPRELMACSQQLTAALIATVVLPSACLWFYRLPLITLWLRDGALAMQVATLSAVMLPAAALGAIGNVPLALLNAASDFAFQARLSAALTLSTLAGVALAASEGTLTAVCWIYLAYFAVLTASLWWRASSLPATKAAARRSAKWVGIASLVVLIPVTAIAF